MSEPVDQTNEYRSDLYVDPCELEKEWNRNGDLAMKWAERHAQAAYDLKMVEQNYKITQAIIESEVRSNPDDFGLQEKLTESMVKMAIRNDSRYKEASENWADAIKIERILFEAKEAMKWQRPSTCKALTSLWIFKFGDSQRIDREVRNAFEKNSEDDLDAHMEKYQEQSKE